MLFLPGTERARAGDQADPQAQEVLHNSSTDSCLTFPYCADSPIPFPPSPAQYVSVSPEGISPLPVVTNNPPIDNVVTHNVIVHTPPIPIPSTIPIFRSSQTHPSIPLSPSTSSYNAPLYPPYLPGSFPQAGPSVFAGISPIPPYFRPSLPITVSVPSPSLPSMATPNSIPAPFSSGRLQPAFGPSPSRGSIKVPKVTLPGGRRAPRGRRRSRVTSTASCQTSPVPSYFWPDFQPRRVSSGGPSSDGALDLALMPRAYNQFPTSLPLDPLHFDFFTILRVASPVVTFHCPSPLSQKSFSSVYSINFPQGEDAKPILITGIHR